MAALADAGISSEGRHLRPSRRRLECLGSGDLQVARRSAVEPLPTLPKGIPHPTQNGRPFSDKPCFNQYIGRLSRPFTINIIILWIAQYAAPRARPHQRSNAVQPIRKIASPAETDSVLYRDLLRIPPSCRMRRKGQLHLPVLVARVALVDCGRVSASRLPRSRDESTAPYAVIEAESRFRTSTEPAGIPTLSADRGSIKAPESGRRARRRRTDMAGYDPMRS